MSKEIHPKVKEFQTFINKHPKLIEEIRRSGKAWQFYYEKWITNGENDPTWNTYINSNKEEKSNSQQSKILDQLLRLSQNIDVDKIQQQVKKLDDTIGTVQSLLNQLMDKKNETGNDPSPNQFNWFRD